MDLQAEEEFQCGMKKGKIMQDCGQQEKMQNYIIRSS